MSNNLKNNNELIQFLEKINLMNHEFSFYKDRGKKFYQIQEYGKQVLALVKKMSGKRTLTFIDCGAGSCYLSFYLNYIIRDYNINFICIDYNKKVIQRAKETAFSLGFANMEFICGDLTKYKPEGRPDLVYSLHACDTATDLTVFTGIRSSSRHILSVSCCQRHTYKQMRKHPLGSITKHKVYKERMVDMVSDTMRSLILEANGYNTDIFEFSSPKHTGKNVMVRAAQIPVSQSKRDNAIDEYNKLRELFNLEPKLMEYIKSSQSILENHMLNVS